MYNSVDEYQSMNNLFSISSYATNGKKKKSKKTDGDTFTLRSTYKYLKKSYNLKCIKFKLKINKYNTE